MRSRSAVSFESHLEKLAEEDAGTKDAQGGAAAKGASNSDKRKQRKKVDLFAMQSAHVDKHRQLKQMLREKRKMEGSLANSRSLVGNFMSSKDAPWRPLHNRKLHDQQKTEQSIKRIQGNLHGCSHARHELMEMQKRMSHLTCAPPSTLCSELKHAFADTLRRKHSEDEFE